MRNLTCRVGFAWLVGLALLGAFCPSAAATAPLPHVRPQEVGMDAWHLAQIDHVVADGLHDGDMPGCVVLVGRRDSVVFLKAYGDRQVEPAREPMTVDTVFDLASLTKPLATATSVMRLVEQGRIALEDPVAKHLPEFGQNGKDTITVAQLLLHVGGLIPDNSLGDYADGPAKAWQQIFAMKPRAAPGERFIYSDMGYVVLAELVHRVSGKPLDAFTQAHLFGPLGMTETGYLPAEPLRRRAAPTEQRAGRWIRGEVHDPRALALGGVAGHAGVFSTASDLAVFASMLLGRGARADARVLQEQTVDEMTRPREVPGGGRRGLGWDIRTGYSSNRGTALSARAFGHGGFTGTALWIDPELDLFVVFLSNRLHPDGRGEVNSLAGRIGTIAGAALQLPAREAPRRPVAANDPPLDEPEVLTGIDVLERDGFRQLKGRRIGLITNHTGLSRGGTSDVRLLADAPGLKLVRLFSPEHGFEGTLDDAVVRDARHAATGLEIASLYGKSRRPTKEMLKGLDTLVFDLQDVGVRFYTYLSTMGYAMEAAARHKLRFVVLDRPNPIGGLEVTGPMRDADHESFVAYHRLPVRHGMTVGELATFLKAERKLDLDLVVVKVEGWRRADFFDATGLRWVNPSPNMRSLTQAVLYPGVGLLEVTNLSVGRGTDTPFEVIGAPWINETTLARHLNAARLPGVRFVPVRFTPTASKFEGEDCGGVNLIVTSRADFRPVRTGLEIARQFHALYGSLWKARDVDRLLCNREALDALLAGKTVTEIQWADQPALQQFLEKRAAALLYE